jgi:hypothetical protein
MTAAAHLLVQLQCRGVTLHLHGDRLRYYPADRVRADELALMRERKAELLHLLAETERRRVYADRTAGHDAEDCAAWHWLLEHGPASLVDELDTLDARCDALIRAGAADGEVRETVRAFVDKLELMRRLYRERQTAPESDLRTEAVLTEDEPAAWRVVCHRLGGRELWIAADGAALEELISAGALDGLPAIVASDVVRLRELDDVALGKVLDALAAFPGSRIADVIRSGTKQ